MLNRDDRLRFGACWYPERWSAARWDEDLRLMREAGLRCVRVGDRAWDRCQRADGSFDWDFHDRVLERAAAHEIGVILATPTACAPAWLEHRHGEVIAERENGVRWAAHAGGCYDLTCPAYRDACRAVVTALAERYAGDARLWAWQLETHWPGRLDALWGASVRAAFQEWLRARYREPAALDAAWGLVAWSKSIDCFEQVDLPGPGLPQRNHHQLADYRAFLADLARAFLDEQRAVIRAADPAAVIVAGATGLPIDAAELAAGVDVVGCAHRPRLASGARERSQQGFAYGLVRHHARRMWAVEQQASQLGQTDYCRPVSPPGELSVAALQSVAHGCDLVAWLPWRSYHAGVHSNLGGVLPHWGRPTRFYREVADLTARLAPHAATIGATRPRVTLARVVSFRQSVGAAVEPWIGARIALDTGRPALIHLGLNENVVRAVDLQPGDGYQVALVPLAIALDADEVAALHAWAAGGGTLVVGPMAGHRDAHLHAPSESEPPGPMAALTGTGNGESTVSDAPMRIRASDGGATIDTAGYAELIEPRDPAARVLATHLTGWLTGQAAVVERPLGQGRVIHAGVALGDRLLEWLWMECGLPRPPAAMAVHEAGAEVLTRSNRDYALHFVLNHGTTSAIAYLSRPVTDLLTGVALTNSFTVPAYGYRILREELR